MPALFQVVSVLLLLSSSMAKKPKYQLVSHSFKSSECTASTPEWQAPDQLVTDTADLMVNKIEQITGMDIKSHEVVQYLRSFCKFGTSIFTVELTAVDAEEKNVTLRYNMNFHPTRLLPLRFALVDPGVLVMREGEETIHRPDGIKRNPSKLDKIQLNFE